LFSDINTVESTSKHTLVVLDYFDDPKGALPKSLVNWAVQYGVPAYVRNLSMACARYVPTGPTTAVKDVDHAVVSSVSLKAAPL
jgi:hypothetical protein